MKAKGINFGGEQSGHIIFSDYAKTGDGISSALQSLAYLITIGKKASEVFNPYTSYPQELVNLPINQKKEFKSIKGYDELIKTLDKNGVRYLFRYSGTENKLRLLVEGANKHKANQFLEELVEFFEDKLS